MLIPRLHRDRLDSKRPSLLALTTRALPNFNIASFIAIYKNSHLEKIEAYDSRCL